MATECPMPGILARTCCILSYSDERRDIVVNYVLLLVNLAWCSIALSFHSADIRNFVKLRRFAAASLMGVVVFQVLLCLALECSGVSIVWCAMGGWIVSERKRLVEHAGSVPLEVRHGRAATAHVEMVVVLCDLVVVVYYGVVSPPITTVAHLCAVILGATLSLLFIRFYDGEGDEDAVSSSTPLVSETE